MPPCRHYYLAMRYLLASGFLAFVTMNSPRVFAQGVPTVQEAGFRSQWVGEQVDQIPLGGTLVPMNGLGAVVGSLQTQDQVNREVQASLAGVQAKSPFAFKQALGLGWQISNQGTLNQGQGSSTNYYTFGNSPFIAPSLAILYDRDHGPWSISAGYSIGYKYFSNQNFVANGTGSQRNPFSQTGLFSSMLQMSRYIFDTLITASSGNGFNSASGSNNSQKTFAANTRFKYLISSVMAVKAEAGYNLQNSSGSVATPNNNTASLFANLAPIYELSDKTHLSSIFGVGQTSQNLSQATISPTNTSSGTNTVIGNNQLASMNYAQLMGKVKYDLTGKTVFDVSLGARYLTGSNISNLVNAGIRPAWAVGLSYTPTEKTSVTFSVGEQGSDIRPEVNLLFNWNPREKTHFTLGISQGQGFANSVSSQYQITQSILGTVTQKLFTSVDFQLSGGYGAQQYVSLSGGVPAQANNQTPASYYLATASLNWKIRDWMTLNNTLNYSGVQTVQGPNGTKIPQTYYSISLNFAL